MNRTAPSTSSSSYIFQDREKLSPRYVPEVLLYRERQLGQLHSFFAASLSNPSRAFLKPLQIVGPTGTGKTSCVLRFGEDFQAKAESLRVKFQHVYVNLKLQGGSRVVLYRYLLERIAPQVYSAGLSAEEMLRVLLKNLAEKETYIILSLDEIDYLLRSTKDTSIVYDLTRLNEIEPSKPSNVLGVVFIAKSKEFHEKLDRAELSTLGRLVLEFPPYKSEEVFEILSERIKEAFVPGVVSDDVVSYIADITVSPPVNGDLRYALDLLLYSGNLAESQGSEKVVPDHVRRIHGEINPTITDEDILNLSRKEQVVALLAVVRSLRAKNKAYASLREIRLNYQSLTEQYEITPTEDLDDYVQDLSDRGLVEVESLKEIGLRGAPVGSLESYLDNLLKRLEVGLTK